MLTPKQIKNHEFQMAGRNAYRSTDVDEFMTEIYESYEQMFRENAELVKKLSLLADKVSEYKKDEDNIRNALLMAERMKDSILADAQDKAKTALSAAEERVRAAKQAVDEKTAAIIGNANAEAEQILSDANSRAEETLKLAQSNATKLLAKAQEIYDEQINTIKEEAEKETNYLNKIKAESVRVRKELMDTYKTQIQILEYTPDFSEEVRELHNNRALEEETEEAVAPVEETTEEIALEETEDAQVDDTNVTDGADESDGEIETESEDVTDDADNEESEDVTIVLESVSRVDEYLTEDEYVSLPDDSDDDEYADEFDGNYDGEEITYGEDSDFEETVYTPDNMELEIKDSDEEGDLTLF